LRESWISRISTGTVGECYSKRVKRLVSLLAVGLVGFLLVYDFDVRCVMPMPMFR
jgi:hypothetical protein